jgi:hypothetical protein
MRFLLIAMSAVPCVALNCAIVEGDRLTGRDLAAAHPRFQRLAPDFDLGPAPVAGARRTLRGSDLERIARDQGLTLALDDAREACFDRKILELSAEQLAEVLEPIARTHVKGSRLEILEFSRTKLPVGALDFRWDDLASTGLWRGRLAYGENRSVPVWARVRLTDAATGESITKSPAPTALEVARGETVLVEVTSGSVRLAFDAAAESSGHIGEAITVRNPANGQRFRAVVEAKGKAGIRK